MLDPSIHPFPNVCHHLVVELSQQLFQGEIDVVLVFLITAWNRGGYNVGANQTDVLRQLFQNIDHLLMCLSNERDPIHLQEGYSIYMCIEAKCNFPSRSSYFQSLDVEQLPATVHQVTAGTIKAGSGD